MKTLKTLSVTAILIIFTINIHCKCCDGCRTRTRGDNESTNSTTSIKTKNPDDKKTNVITPPKVSDSQDGKASIHTNKIVVKDDNISGKSSEITIIKMKPENINKKAINNNNSNVKSNEVIATITNPDNSDKETPAHLNNTIELNNSDESNELSIKQPNNLENKNTDDSFKEFRDKIFKPEIVELTSCSKTKAKDVYIKCREICFKKEGTYTFVERVNKGINNLSFFVVLKSKSTTENYYKIVMNESDLSNEEEENILKFEKNNDKYTISYYLKTSNN